MRLTEEQMKEKLYVKLNDDFALFVDELIKGGRDKVIQSIPELSTKYDMILEFEYFFPLKGKSLKAVLNQKHPLEFLYNEWQKDNDLCTEEAHFAIVEVAEREAKRLESQKLRDER